MSISVLKMNNISFKPETIVLNTNTITNDFTFTHNIDTLNRGKRKSKMSFGALRDGIYSRFQDQDAAREQRKFRVSQTDAEILSHKVQLTPDKIDYVIKTASSRDAGIVAAFRELGEEGKVWRAGTKTMHSLYNRFSAGFDERMAIIRNVDPIFSHVPVIGVIPQVIDLFFGFYRDRMNEFSQELVKEGNNVINTYYTKGYVPLSEGFLESSTHLASQLSVHPRRILGVLSDFMDFPMAAKKLLCTFAINPSEAKERLSSHGRLAITLDQGNVAVRENMKVLAKKTLMLERKMKSETGFFGLTLPSAVRQTGRTATKVASKIAKGGI